MKLYTIDTGYFKLDGGAMFGVVPKVLWGKVHPADERNLCTWAMRCLLVETDGRLILIDNGIGAKQDAKFFGHYHLHGDATLEGSLKKHGFTPEDITDVFLTHLHFDHCGGSIKRVGEKLVPAFKNATYWSNKFHWEWATRPNPREKASFLKENILPIQESGQLKFVDVERKDATGNPYVSELFPGFDVLLVNGHTDAMMIPHIAYKGHTLIYMADLIPSANHIPIPWVISYDTRPLLSMQEKALVLEAAADKGSILYFEHDPVTECAVVEHTEKGVRLKETLRLEDL
ncbi:MAG: MBL fold metallo-hydrolase [Flavobacteriales bacterium]|jgi:glyoxylase-like metal-dependent hydrolase (beta-lactamase superfamily II)|nr:MBL fold metallo-hydrolase [Flavobacteriales bacterium]